ncbi:VC0807 family protein [Kutzneria sp. NPDC051319]|uniref:VC0807 family protein n=1 Tax=Kutzneria sp. NPDC051319 TaxID=3155047 RepID=UPI00343C10CE
MSTPQSIQLRRFLPSIVLNAVVPLVIYTLVRPYFANDVTALIIAGAIPLAATLVGFVVRRKLDVIGAISVVGFVVAVAAQLLTGGDGLIVKVQGVVVTGPVGVLFLLSALIGRPLVGVIFQFLARRNPAMRVPTKSRSTALTLVIGGMFVLHAVVAVTLALTLPTPVFLAVSNPIGLSIIAVGFGIIFLMRRRWQVSAADVQPR